MVARSIVSLAKKSDSSWRAAGMNYLNYSNVAAAAVRRGLKAEHAPKMADPAPFKMVVYDENGNPQDKKTLGEEQ
eukprot:Clim_evm4s226 gene=Clim_evmTU4s226